jgi:hypothetical protein
MEEISCIYISRFSLMFGQTKSLPEIIPGPVDRLSRRTLCVMANLHPHLHCDIAPTPPCEPDLIPVRSDLAERELGLLLIDRDRDHLPALHVHGIIR